MQYSPKLKKAMEEIKQILIKHDIGAFVTLHDPDGFSEYLNRIDPSYSCARLEYVAGEMAIRVKTNSKVDGKEKTHKLLSDTYNMVYHLSEMVARHAIFYMDLEKMMKDRLDAYTIDDGSGHTSHEQQNN